MNKLIVYSVRDLKAEYFISPFTLHSDAEAIRSFGDAVSKGGTTLSDHPEDFQLYKVGEFDIDSGLIVSFPSPVALAMASDFKNGGAHE